jgi:thiol:disulfide interchange protein DsbD
MTISKLQLSIGAIAVGLVILASPACPQAIDLDALGGTVQTSTYVSLTSVPRGGTAQIAVEIRISHPWHINAHELDDEFLVPTEISFEAPEGVVVKEIVYPEGVAKKLDFSDAPLALYEGTVLIGAVIEVGPEAALGKTSLSATLTYQACDNHKCLLPETEKLFVPLTVSSAQSAIDAANPEIFSQIDFSAAGGAGSGGEEGALQRAVASGGLFVAFVVVFLGGLALNLTPCVYPIIPITVSYFGGQSSGKKSNTVLLALTYLLGMATMYSTLGLVAALTGGILGSALQNAVVLAFVALVMVGLALSMFGFYEIRVPAAISGIAGTAKQGAVGSFLMGLTVGIVAAPCIGPFVLGLLTFVGESGDPLLGFSMFFTLAVGLGLPFVALAIASGNISRLPKSGEWMEWVRKLFGVVLLAMALFFLRPVLTDPVYFAILGVLLVVSGVLMGFVLKVTSSLIFFNSFRRFVGVAGPLFGLYLILAPGHIIARGGATGIPWEPYDDQRLLAAQSSGSTVVIDFSAEWCLPCKELEHKTFNQSAVIAAASRVVPLKADLTRSGSDEVVRLRKKYEIRGVPTIVFLDGNGKERKDLRVFGFVGPEEFVERLNALTAPAP